MALKRTAVNRQEPKVLVIVRIAHASEADQLPELSDDRSTLNDEIRERHRSHCRGSQWHQHQTRYLRSGNQGAQW